MKCIKTGPSPSETHHITIQKHSFQYIPLPRSPSPSCCAASSPNPLAFLLQLPDCNHRFTVLLHINLKTNPSSRASDQIYSRQESLFTMKFSAKFLSVLLPLALEAFQAVDARGTSYQYGLSSGYGSVSSQHRARLARRSTSAVANLQASFEDGNVPLSINMALLRRRAQRRLRKRTGNGAPSNSGSSHHSQAGSTNHSPHGSVSSGSNYGGSVASTGSGAHSPPAGGNTANDYINLIGNHPAAGGSGGSSPAPSSPGSHHSGPHGSDTSASHHSHSSSNSVSSSSSSSSGASGPHNPHPRTPPRPNANGQQPNHPPPRTNAHLFGNDPNYLYHGSPPPGSPTGSDSSKGSRPSKH